MRGISLMFDSELSQNSSIANHVKEADLRALSCLPQRPQILNMRCAITNLFVRSIRSTENIFFNPSATWIRNNMCWKRLSLISKSWTTQAFIYFYFPSLLITMNRLVLHCFSMFEKAFELNAQRIKPHMKTKT